MMVAGPVEVVDGDVWGWMRVEGTKGFGEQQKLRKREWPEVRRSMLKWFGHQVVWGGAERIILLQVFFRLTKGMEQWRREGTVEEEGSSGGGK